MKLNSEVPVEVAFHLSFVFNDLDTVVTTNFKEAVSYCPDYMYSYSEDGNVVYYYEYDFELDKMARYAPNDLPCCDNIAAYLWIDENGDLVVDSVEEG